MKRRVPSPLLPTLLAFVLNACGGSGVGPTPLPSPQVATHPVTFIAFLDENENRVFEPNEGTRIPGVELVAPTIEDAYLLLIGDESVAVAA